MQLNPLNLSNKAQQAHNNLLTNHHHYVGFVEHGILWNYIHSRITSAATVIALVIKKVTDQQINASQNFVAGIWNEIHRSKSRKYVNLLVSGKSICLRLDTASNVTLISKNTWRKLGCPRIQLTEHVARNEPGDIVKLT